MYTFIYIIHINYIIGYIYIYIQTINAKINNNVLLVNTESDIPNRFWSDLKKISILFYLKVYILITNWYILIGFIDIYLIGFIKFICMI